MGLAHLYPCSHPPTTTNLDIYQRVSVLLEGEQNLFLSCVGSEQHATPCTPHPFSFLPLLDTHMHGIVPGEGTASIRRTTNPHLEVLKPPNPNEELLHEAGGACLGSTGHVHAAGKVGTKAVECMTVEAHKPGGASLDMDAAPAPTEGTTSVKLFGMAEKAATTEPEALEPRAEGEAWHGLETPLLPLSQEDSGESRTLPREAPTEGICRCRLEALLLLLREGPSKGKCKPKRAL